MINRRLQIQGALKNMVYEQRHREFQWLATQVAKLKWPELEATKENNDGGEDITSAYPGADGLKRVGAISLTGTLAKIKKDAKRLRERGVKIDVLIFITPVDASNVDVSEWRKEIEKEFGHGLHVIPQSELIAVLEQPANAWICRDYLNLRFGAESVPAENEAAIRITARALLSEWKEEWRFNSAEVITLTYAYEDPQARNETAKLRPLFENLLRPVGPTRRFALIGAPGAGKTFTLISLAEQLLSDSSFPVPLLISLSEWAASDEDLVKYGAKLFAASGITEASLEQLMGMGLVTLLLNGWNEISDQFAESAKARLRSFARAHPATAIVLTTRQGVTSQPLAGAQSIYLEPLSMDQKRQIARKRSGGVAEKLLPQLEANESLREIADSPLFLNALIELLPEGQALPATRFGILSRFVERIETSPEHESALNSPPCSGLHRRYLSCIASDMLRKGTTSFSSDELFQSIARCNKALESEGHLSTLPTSSAIASCLVNHHLLVHSKSTGGNYRFAHQQFQEWFAAGFLSEWITEIKIARRANDIFAFQSQILNRIPWHPALEFLLERLSEGDSDDAQTAAELIRWALPLDLNLASQLAGIAGDAVWKIVAPELEPLLRRWHRINDSYHRSCALTAMLSTRSGNFSDIILPMLGSDDQQVRWEIPRGQRPLALSSLGPDWLSTFRSWNDEKRTEFVHQLQWQPRQEHIALAAELAVTDDNINVKTSCLELLLGAHASETLNKVLADPAFVAWVDKLRVRDLLYLPKACLYRLLPKLKTALPDLQDYESRHAIVSVLEKLEDPSWISLAQTELDRIVDDPAMLTPDGEGEVMVGTERSGAFYFIQVYLNAIRSVNSEWANKWLSGQLIQGRLWEDRFFEKLDVVDNDVLRKIASVGLSSAPDLTSLDRRLSQLKTLKISAVVEIFINELLSYEKAPRVDSPQSSRDRGDILEFGIRDFPVSASVGAVIQVATEITDFETLYRLLTLVMPRAPLDTSLRIELTKPQKTALRDLVLRVTALIPRDYMYLSELRAYLGVILGAVGEAKDSAILERWIEEDAAERLEQQNRFQVAVIEWEASGKRGSYPQRTNRISYSNWHQGALVQLGGSEAIAAFKRLLQRPESIGDAAIGLVLLSGGDEDFSKDSFNQRPKYTDIVQRQGEWPRSLHPLSAQGRDHADAIFYAVTKALSEKKQDDKTFPSRSVERGVIALASLEDLRAIDLLFSFSSNKHALGTIVAGLHTLILKGAPVPGARTATALELFITEHEQSRHTSGGDMWFAAIEALAVLVFSDNPSIGLQRIRQTPADRRNGYHVRELFVLLGTSKMAEAACLLRELASAAEVQKHFFRDLVAALQENGTLAARQSLWELFSHFSKSQSAGSMVEPLAEAIGILAECDPAIWMQVQSQCKSSVSQLERNYLSRALAAMGTEEAALALCELIHDEFPVTHSMEEVIENAILSRSAAGRRGYYTRKPQECSKLKARLIGLVRGDSTRRASASHLMAIITRSRMDIGYPSKEAIEPEFQRGETVPWQLF